MSRLMLWVKFEKNVASYVCFALDYLLKIGGADCSLADRCGNTALHYACMNVSNI